MPTTQPARGFSWYRIAVGPFPPLERPASRTSPACCSPASAWDTVGLDSAVSRASCAREIGPMRRTHSSTVRSLIARSKLGVPVTAVPSIAMASPR